LIVLPTQLNLFAELEMQTEEAPSLSRANLGTFQDCLRSPVHRWFTYPAGFSFKAVEEAFRLYKIVPGKTVYDPFAGTGTTNLTASQQGISSYGVEAHPFVYFVAQTKLFWDFDFPTLHREIDNLIEFIKGFNAQSDIFSKIEVETLFPELVCKCYGREKLTCLYLCREAINALTPGSFKDFAKLGLTSLLRTVADVATGWPYIAPQKARKNIKIGNLTMVAEKLRDQLYKMYADLQQIRPKVYPAGQTTLIAGDARQYQEAIPTGSIDLSFTSPPYLNNYDYADRTRLETYFWGEAKTWGDITRQVRTRLITSATTQINRSNYDAAHLLNQNLLTKVPSIASELNSKIGQLSQNRLVKGGKKSYDILVAGYFNDMLAVFQETFRVLKSGSSFLLILGDSAPYGVYIPTDLYLGEIGKAVGFTDYTIENLRVRGGKWKNNPQRHNLALKECILTLRKS